MMRIDLESEFKSADLLGRSLVAISVAVHLAPSSNDELPLSRAVAEEGRVAAVDGLSLAWGTIGERGLGDTVGRDAVCTFGRKGAFREAGGVSICSSEARLLRRASAFIERLPAPVLVTWSKFDALFLHNRGFPDSTSLTWWLGSHGSPGFDSSEEAWRYTNVQYLLHPPAHKTPLEYELRNHGLGIPDEVNGLLRLEFLATGIFALAIRALWRCDQLDYDVALATLARFFDRCRKPGMRRPDIDVP